MRRESGVLAWLLVALGGVLLALLGWQFVGYRASLRLLPPGMTVAGLDVGGMSAEEATARLESAFAQPVEVSYQGEMLSLSPDVVEFRFDPAEMRATLEAAAAARRSLNGFMAYLLRRPVAPIFLPPAATYSAERLDGFLARVAQQYDRPAQPPVPLLERLTFRAGLPGYRMDRQVSAQRVGAALLSAVDRRAELAVLVEEAEPLRMAQLGEMLNGLLADFPGVAAVFVKGLETGEELALNADVAFSGMDVLRLAVAVEAYRALDGPPTAAQTTLLTQTVTGTDDGAANDLLRDLSGGGDVYQGLENLNGALRYLGLQNSFLAVPYGDTAVPPTIVTPANSRSDVDTQPDLRGQTTAQDIGLLLEMVYQCSRGGGALLVAYPGAFTPDECQQMMETLATNRAASPIGGGLPAAAGVASRSARTATVAADGAILSSPGGDFILVVFLYNPLGAEPETSDPLIGDIATAVYNYFNPVE